MASWLRRVVSQQKRRLTDSGFDLDLSYIVEDPRRGNVIAMGVPVSGRSAAALWRNRRSEVQRFLDARHGAGGYRVYNLCSEAEYEHPRGRFGGNVAVFPCDDHQVPPLWMIRDFCEDAAAFLGGGEGRTVAVHCKAGRGRTGLMLCAYLLHSGICGTSAEAVALFNSKRTMDGQGLTVPSQLRFIQLYERMLRGELPDEERPLTLRRVTLRGPPQAKLARCSIHVSMRQGREVAPRKVLTITAGTTLTGDAPDDVAPRWAAVVADGELSAGSQANPPSPILEADLLIEVLKPGSASKLACYCWLHTAALDDSLVFELAGSQLDKVDKSLQAGLQLRLEFLPADAS